MGQALEGTLETGEGCFDMASLWEKGPWLQGYPEERDRSYCSVLNGGGGCIPFGDLCTPSMAHNLSSIMDIVQVVQDKSDKEKAEGPSTFCHC